MPGLPPGPVSIAPASVRGDDVPELILHRILHRGAADRCRTNESSCGTHGKEWKKSLDIPIKWDYTIHWTAITLATIDLESRIDFSLGLLRQANSCGG